VGESGPRREYQADLRATDTPFDVRLQQRTKFAIRLLACPAIAARADTIMCGSPLNRTCRCVTNGPEETGAHQFKFWATINSDMTASGQEQLISL